MQLMLSKFEYDGKLNQRFRLGEFALPIERIEGVADRPTASKFVHVSSAGVTRPGRKGLDLEKARQLRLCPELTSLDSCR